jgi:hypothetical protein
MTVAEAVEIAKSHLTDVLPEFGKANVQLEELEAAPHHSKWSFTFSATLPPSSSSAYGVSLAEALRGRRIAKSVEIDSDTGSLLSIKNVAA